MRILPRVKDLMVCEVLSEALAVATSVYNAHRKELPSPCETRWNSLLRLIFAVLLKVEGQQSAHHVDDDNVTHLDENNDGDIVDVDNEGRDTTRLFVHELESNDNDEAGEEEEKEEEEEEDEDEDVDGEDDKPNEGGVPLDMQPDEDVTIPIPKPEELPVAAISDDNTALLTRAAVILAPFMSATNWLQSNAATVYDMAIVFGLLAKPMPAPYDIYRGVLAEDKRKKMIMQPAVAFIAYYHPGLRQAEAPDEVLNYLKSVADKTASVLRPSKATVEMLESEMDLWEREGSREPGAKPDGYTLDEFVSFWDNHPSFPVLSGLLCTLVRIAASEACVERAFSEIKHTFRSNRQRARDSAVASQFILKSLLLEPSRHKPLKGAHRYEDNYVQDASKQKRFTVEHASALFDFVPFSKPRPADDTAERARIERMGTVKCCDKLRWHHEECRYYLRCSTCSGLWMKRCLDMKEGVFISVQSRINGGGDWTCLKCKPKK